MTESELRQYPFCLHPFCRLTNCKDLAMTSGFSTIAGSVLTAYINLGVPAQNLITSSVMSIPASIAISKMRIPETQEPVTRGKVIVDRGDEGRSKPVSVELAASANVRLAFARQTPFMLSVRARYLVSSSPVRFCEDLIYQCVRNLTSLQCQRLDSPCLGCDVRTFLRFMQSNVTIQ